MVYFDFLEGAGIGRERERERERKNFIAGHEGMFGHVLNIWTNVRWPMVDC